MELIWNTMKFRSMIELQNLIMEQLNLNFCLEAKITINFPTNSNKTTKIKSSEESKRKHMMICGFIKFKIYIRKPPKYPFLFFFQHNSLNIINHKFKMIFFSLFLLIVH